MTACQDTDLVRFALNALLMYIAKETGEVDMDTWCKQILQLQNKKGDQGLDICYYALLFSSKGLMCVSIPANFNSLMLYRFYRKSYSSFVVSVETLLHLRVHTYIVLCVNGLCIFSVFLLKHRTTRRLYVQIVILDSNRYRMNINKNAKKHIARSILYTKC